jgi:hypothetical protein
MRNVLLFTPPTASKHRLLTQRGNGPDKIPGHARWCSILGARRRLVSAVILSPNLVMTVTVVMVSQSDFSVELDFPKIASIHCRATITRSPRLPRLSWAKAREPAGQENLCDAVLSRLRPTFVWHAEGANQHLPDAHIVAANQPLDDLFRPGIVFVSGFLLGLCQRF